MVANARPHHAPASRLPHSERVLLLVDFINPLDFPGAEDLADSALAAARETARLKAALHRQDVPTVYANDNYGLWQSDFRGLVEDCAARPGACGELARLLRPQPSDIAILKPRHSAFFGTPLSLMLAEMGTREIIICGLATDMCVQMTAADAFLREYACWVPPDCSAAESEQAHRASIQYMASVLKCDVHPAGPAPPPAPLSG